MIFNEAKLKKMFVWHCLPRVLLEGSVGRHFFLFLIFTICTWPEMVKRKKILDLEKKNLSSSKTGESVGNAKQTIFYFWPEKEVELFLLTTQSDTSRMTRKPVFRVSYLV